MITIFIIVLLIQPKHAHVIQVSTGKCPVRLGLRELMDRFLIQTNRAQFYTAAIVLFLVPFIFIPVFEF
jgi:hypothetical protein